jgi:hypothetical protein
VTSLRDRLECSKCGTIHFDDCPPKELPHRCHARGCSVEVKPELLMCLAHWRRVPSKIQRAVWAAYRPGQCDDKQVSKEWLLAADAAIGHVALKNGGKISENERRALRAFGF